MGSHSNSYNTVNKNSTLIKSVLNYLPNCRCCFLFLFLFSLRFHAATPKNPNSNPFLYFIQFSPPSCISLFAHKTITAIQPTLFSTILQALLFTSLFLHTAIPTILTKYCTTSAIYSIQAPLRAIDSCED